MKFEWVTCKSCWKKYKRGMKKATGLPIGIRSVNTKTCSPKCSKKNYYKKKKQLNTNNV